MLNVIGKFGLQHRRDGMFKPVLHAVPTELQCVGHVYSTNITFLTELQLFLNKKIRQK
jgi:hypothetical protein